MIAHCCGDYPVRMMCRCLRVSTAGYYAWRRRTPSPRTRANETLLRRIRTIFDDSDGVRGSPKITELVREGYRCSQNRVARLMQRAGLKGIPQKRQWRKKTSQTRPMGIQNHLNRDFKADRPDQKWVSDITYIRTGEGWLYLCIVLDLATDMVVGVDGGSAGSRARHQGGDHGVGAARTPWSNVPPHRSRHPVHGRGVSPRSPDRKPNKAESLGCIMVSD